MVTAAEHAATVREALLRFYPGKNYNMAEVALNALVAQAETAADWKLRGDEAEHSLGHCRGLLEAAEAEVKRLKKITGKYSVYDALKAAEAERDAAVQALAEMDADRARVVQELHRTRDKRDAAVQRAKRLACDRDICLQRAETAERAAEARLAQADENAAVLAEQRDAAVQAAARNNAAYLQAREERRHAQQALQRAHDALDDAIKAAVNSEWSQGDYDEWDAAREIARAALTGDST